ncbi:DoxX family protein [Parvibaculum sp.]|uniref:DoxX family protein n=1 Tax=Parvibaculum sp. TaxID=2024848 RepID=UPI00391C9EA8
MTPGFVAAILEAPATAVVTRILLTFMFWGSGLGLLANFGESVEIIASLGFSQPALVVIATAATQLVGSALVITGRHVWLGAGALGVFTFLTILLVHNFWAMPEGPQKVNSFHTATEHVSMIGALILVSIFMHQRQNRKFS